MSTTGYASDITRTFAVGEPFSERQRQIYDVVLAAQAFHWLDLPDARAEFEATLRRLAAFEHGASLVGQLETALGVFRASGNA